MRGSTAKLFRRQANGVAARTVDALAPGIQAAVDNERLTRARVDELEAWLSLFSGLSFWGRLRWLLRGK